MDPADLPPALETLRKQRDPGQAAEMSARVRAGFEDELGFRVNRERLAGTIERAGRADAGLPAGLERLLSLTGKAYVESRNGNRGPVPAPPVLRKGQCDIVMFWKQNDTGLYGRRSDMVMKHLLHSGRIRRVLHLDAPMKCADLARGIGSPKGSSAAQILRNAVDNQFGLRDSDRHLLRTYLWGGRGGGEVLPGIGRDLSQYPDFVLDQMAQAGMKPETTLAWVCPVVFDFPQVARRIPFHAIIGDLIDDQRNFAAREVYRERIIASYNDTLPLLDLAFTNCHAMSEAFGGLTGPIHVVPNGTERLPDDPGPAPDALCALRGPIAGYVGNLRDRFAWDLIAEVARRLPGVQFPIIGGGAREEDAAKVRALPNVHLLGVVPHEQVAACLDRFDVALIPHERTTLTSRMNPLKVYSYFAARKPIVATEVENIDDDIMPFIRYAGEPAEFAAAVEAACTSPHSHNPATYDSVLDGILWETRVGRMLERLDRWLETAA